LIKSAEGIADLTKEKCLAKQITESEDYKEGEVKKLGEIKDAKPGCTLTPRTNEEIETRRKERQKDLEEREKRMERKESSERKTMWNDMKRMDVDSDRRRENPGSSSAEGQRRTVLTPRISEPTATSRTDSVRSGHGRSGSVRISEPTATNRTDSVRSGHGRSGSVNARRKPDPAKDNVNHSHRILTKDNRDTIEPGDTCRIIRTANGHEYQVSKWVYVMMRKEEHTGSRLSRTGHHDGVEFYMMADYKNKHMGILRSEDGSCIDPIPDTVQIREDHADDLESGRAQVYSAVCVLITGMCDWFPVGDLMVWIGEYGRVVAVNVRREPRKDGFTEMRIQGTLQVQYATASAAKACIEGLHGREIPDILGSRAPKRTIAVQRADREFNIGLMSGDPEFQRANGCRVDAAGRWDLIYPRSSPWMYASFLSNGYDRNHRIGNETDMIRVVFPDVVRNRATDEDMEEWMIIAEKIQGTVSTMY